MQRALSVFRDTLFADIKDEKAKNEAASIAALLAFLDSIHDFWPERGKKSAGDEDEDEPEELDETRLEKVHDELVKSIRAYVGAKKEITIEQILTGLTNNNVGSVHGVEDKTLAYLKKSVQPFNGPEVVFTIKDILTKWKFTDYGSDWTKYSGAISTIANTIEIQGDGRSVKSLTDEERGHIGFFILAYMNPQVNPGSSSVGLTFDMSPRDVGKIFNRFKQVYNAIYPQNVSDSATTSFSALLGRSQYFNVQGTLGPTPGVQQLARTNAFTLDNFNIYFVDGGFGPKNKFGFSIVIADKAGKEVGRIPFGPRNEQGPSVNYLMDIIASYPENPAAHKSVVPKIGTVAKLNGLNITNTELLTKLLFDIKRLGDQEQMLVAGNGVYTVTGDRFAHAFRRLIRKSGIYHSVKGLRISRFGALSPEEAEKQSMTFRLASTYEKLKVVLSFLGQYQTAGSDLNIMRNHVLFGVQKGYVFSEPIDIPTQSGPEFIDQYYTKIGSTFATAIARYRMIDILEHIDKLTVILNQVLATPDLKQNAQVLEQSVQSRTFNANTISALDKVDIFLAGIEDLRDMNISFDGTGTAIPLYTQLFEPNGRMIKGVNNTFFNFSTGPFTHPESGLASVVSKLLVNRKARRPDAVKDLINKLLVQYLTSRDMIKEAFFNKTYLSAIETATDISNGLTPGQVVGSADISPGQQGILQAIVNTYQGVSPRIAQYKTLPEATAPPARGGVQIGSGPGQVLQYRDIHDLFVEICNDATVAVESGDTGMHALDTIEAKWVNGINELRQQAMDDYGEAFEESVTTDILSFILSFRTVKDINGRDVTDYGVTFNRGDTTIYPTLNATLVTPPPGRTDTVVNDIGGILLTQIPVEPVVLNFLMALDTAFQTNPFAYSAPAEWRSFWTQFYGYFNVPKPKNQSRELANLLRGGGYENSLGARRPLYSNAQASRTSRSEPVNHPRLRKRARTRRTPRVRQSARKSKTRR